MVSGGSFPKSVPAKMLPVISALLALIWVAVGSRQKLTNGAHSVYFVVGHRYHFYLVPIFQELSGH